MKTFTAVANDFFQVYKIQGLVELLRHFRMVKTSTYSEIVRNEYLNMTKDLCNYILEEESKNLSSGLGILEIWSEFYSKESEYDKFLIDYIKNHEEWISIFMWFSDKIWFKNYVNRVKKEELIRKRIQQQIIGQKEQGDSESAILGTFDAYQDDGFDMDERLLKCIIQ